MTTASRETTPNTKLRILQLLRGGERSVFEISRGLGLARNTVRTHLTALERQNLVERTGVRRGPTAGKPAHLFQLTSDARIRFSKAYIPFLQTLLATLVDEMGQEQFTNLMQAVGQRLAPKITPGTPPDVRLATVTTILEGLGATLATAKTNGSTLIEGVACPLGEVVSHHPLVCRAVETMLSSALGVRLVTECNYDGIPACRFRSE